VTTIAERYDAFLFDLDGVLYRGSSEVPGASAAVSRLRTMGKRIAFVTNNSSGTPDTVAERLRGVGIEADAAEVETSALTSASLLAARGIGVAYVVGEDGIRTALGAAGIAVAGDDDEPVDAVVVGLDRAADYRSLARASVLVERGAALIATNPDTSFPAPNGERWPGAGALLATIVATTGARPEVIGKPHPPILRSALRRVGGERPLVIGDRLDTDVAGAAAVGWDSLLVLTGIAMRADLADCSIRPTYVGDDLSCLFERGPELAG
jgi:glycerol 3-phosphatase-2